MTEEINNSSEQDKSIEEFSETFIEPQNQSDSTAHQPNIFDRMKVITTDILEDFKVDTSVYAPKNTVSKIQGYMNSQELLDRILYSEISIFISSLTVEERGSFNTNMDHLITYIYDSRDDIESGVKKWITKIYDHSQLAIYQIEKLFERATKIFLESNSKTKEQFEMQFRKTSDKFISKIETTKKDTETQIKSIEKEYISILGIFASIILTFVGGMTFSTSVLQNISSVSIFRLLLTVDFLAVVLINTIYILIKFILVINDKDIGSGSKSNHRKSKKIKSTLKTEVKIKEKQIFNIKAFNVVCLLISIIILIAWLVDVNTLRNILSQHFPWNK